MEYLEQLDAVALLRLLHLADSALPIGWAAHSWGLETLVWDGSLEVAQLETFLTQYLQEMGHAEGLCCRLGYRLAAEPDDIEFAARWLALNAQVSALKTARENRVASAMLGRRLTTLLYDMERAPQSAQRRYSLQCGLWPVWWRAGYQRKCYCAGLSPAIPVRSGFSLSAPVAAGAAAGQPHCLAAQSHIDDGGATK
jgi:urease accessory protein UreF